MSKKRTSPSKRPATAADIKRAKNEATEATVRKAWSIFFTVLRDKEGYSLEDLIRVWREIEDLSDSIARGYCTVADLKDVLRQETGARIREE